MNPLVGRYKLELHGIFETNGSYTPTSSYVNGELTYSADGHLSVLIVFKETPELADDIFGYSGTYNIVSGEIVEHYIAMATTSSQRNTTEIRTFSINQNKLSLSKKMADGRRFEAVWIKIE